MSVLKKTVTLENLTNHAYELLMVLYVLYTNLVFYERCLKGKYQYSAEEFQEDSELLLNLNQAIGELEEFNKETIKHANDQSIKDLNVAAIDTQGHNFLLYYFPLIEKSLGTVKKIISTKFLQPETIETVSNVKSIVEKMIEN